MQNATASSGGVVNRSRFAATRVLATLVLTVLVLGSVSRAAPVINYGNFGPIAPGVTFTSVQESSGTDANPLFGPPTPFVTGLDFDPVGFTAFASGGAQDVTDGQLNFGVSAPGGINSLSLFEAGDYTLVGTGTAATQAIAGAIVRITVLEVNGLAVTPFDLAPANSSVGFNLIANPGVVQPWSLGIVDTLNLPQGQKATRIEVSINNQLLALSQTASTSFIAKKDFRISIDAIPEPGSLALAGIGLSGLALRRRRVSMN